MLLFEATFEASAPMPELPRVVALTTERILEVLGDEAREQQLVEFFKVGVTETTAPDKVKFTVDVEPTSSYPMSKVHAMVFQIHPVIAKLIEESTREFSVKTKVNEAHLRDFMRAIPQDDSIFEPTSVWFLETNRQTILDIADWFRTVGPIYEGCLVTPERYTNADELFDPLTIESQSIQSALSRDKTNIVLLSPYEKGLVTQDQLELVGSPDGDGLRIPCKAQGSLDRSNLHAVRFVDIQKAGLSLNHFVSQADYMNSVDLSEDGTARVFAIIPSYLKYPGLVSESVLRGGDTLSAMHCGVDPGKTYQTSFMFPCGLSRGLNLPGGKACVSDDTMYKRKNPRGQQCRFPTAEGVGLDSGCCVISSGRFLRDTMVMYARKTVAHDRQYSYLKDIYEWYTQSIGPIRAHETSITKVYPPESEDDINAYNAFSFLKPNVKELVVFYPDTTKVTTLGDWCGEVDKVFRIRERYDVRLVFPMVENARNIDNEHVARAIQGRPKRKLTLELHDALFVDNNPGPIFNAMHGTENFHLRFELQGREQGTEGAERIPDPTNNIVKAGFVENEDAQRLFRDDEYPDDFEDFREFGRDHVTVEMSLTFSRLELDVITSYAFV